MSKKPLNNDDRGLFRQHMKEVTPLKAERRVSHRPTPKKITIRQPEQETPIHYLQSTNEADVTAEDKLFYTTQGVQQRTLKQLRKGLLRCEAELDLHGHTVASAEQVLGSFLTEVQQAGLRCIRIIHGKGYAQLNPYPVLKNQLNRWLRHHPAVLSFSSAQPKHGGTGALYLLLKKLG